MNMIEVDPKLFIKCRLCLDETGQYQIAPNVQMQIKYCFDIDVEPFDGLPQLVCKKCESILSQYSGIKQIFQEKQKNLKSKLSSTENVKLDGILQQQQDTVSSTQAETENKNKIERTARYNSITPVPTRSSSTETVTSNLSQKRNRKTIVGKISKNIWESSYTKHFVCRFCAKFFKDKKTISYHIQKQCKWYIKYSKINKEFCLVALNKIGSKPNFTGSIENVVCNENKIIQSRKANYYILYTNNSSDRRNSSDSSDEDFIFDKKKRKRRRLISRSSNETVVIDQNSGKRSDDEKFAKVRNSRKGKDTQIASDIECVDIEDSDSNSTKSVGKAKAFESETSQRDQTKTINDKMINNIIAMCSNKYMNRLNVSEGGNTNRGKEESSLKHKILSIGRKVIHGKGISTTGLLRYMEHKNLEVLWIPKMDTKVTIRTRSRESSEVDKSQFGWENITTIQNHIIQDFALVFEKNLTLEASIDENNEEYQGTQLNLHESLNQNENRESALIYFQKLKEIETKSGEDNLNNDNVSGKITTYIDSSERKANLHESLNQNENRESSLIYFQKLKEIETKSGEDNSNNDNMSGKITTYIDSSERKANENNTYLRALLDADRNSTKLLNANPVANPKQLPKKNSFNEPASIVKLYSNEQENDSESVENSNTENSNEILHMPIITSTVSLAPTVNIVEQPNVAYSNQNEMHSVKNGPQSTMPKIKVKPVSELMYDAALNQQNKSSFVSTTGWTVNNESQHQNVVLKTNDSNMVYLANPQFTNVIPVQQDLVFYPQTQDTQAVGFNPTVNQLGSKQQQKDCEYVLLHTVELPNTRTESPFRYFQKLLEMHNLILLDSVQILSNTMQCLTKFKVVFEQESNSPVKLCLLLYCQNNIFCIKAKDHLLKELDIARFSANWQWEILKVFRGDDVVPKLLASASRFGGPIYNYTSYFTNLLRSIIFSKLS